MKGILFLLLLLFPGLYSFGQNTSSENSPTLKNENSLRMAIPDKPFFTENLLLNESFGLPDMSLYKQPLLPDYNANLDFKRYLGNLAKTDFSVNSSGTYYNPYVSSFQIFNQSTYQLSDRLKIGGNSFGATTVFDTPVLNPGIQKMSIQGANLFMQYKVTDKFKIETRVSISNQRLPLLP
jgi:hypothetical protein